jgi:hypothetical protein
MHAVRWRMLTLIKRLRAMERELAKILGNVGRVLQHTPHAHAGCPVCGRPGGRKG